MNPSERPEAREAREDLPSEINLYVVEQTKTHEDAVTERGSGYSSELKAPQRESNYFWEGELQPSEFERKNPNPQKGIGKSSMSQGDIEKLAQGFAYNYRERQNPDLSARGESSYFLKFNPSPETLRGLREKYGEGVVVRGFNVDEQRRFDAAFREANAAAQREKMAKGEIAKPKAEQETLSEEEQRLEHLKKRAKEKPNAPFIRVKGKGFYEVPAWVVVEMSEPGVGLGSPIGLGFASKAFKYLGEQGIISKEPYKEWQLVRWAGNASEAVDLVEQERKSRRP